MPSQMRYLIHSPVFRMLLLTLLLLQSSTVVVDGMQCSDSGPYFQTLWPDQPSRWFPALNPGGDNDVSRAYCMCLGWQTFKSWSGVGMAWTFVRGGRSGTCGTASPWCNSFVQTSSSLAGRITCGCNPGFTGTKCTACAAGYQGFPDCRPECTMSGTGCSLPAAVGVTELSKVVSGKTTYQCQCVCNNTGINPATRCTTCVNPDHDIRALCQTCRGKLARFPKCETRTGTRSTTPGSPSQSSTRSKSATPTSTQLATPTATPLPTRSPTETIHRRSQTNSHTRSNPGTLSNSSSRSSTPTTTLTIFQPPTPIPRGGSLVRAIARVTTAPVARGVVATAAVASVMTAGVGATLILDARRALLVLGALYCKWVQTDNGPEEADFPFVNQINIFASDSNNDLVGTELVASQYASATLLVALLYVALPLGLMLISRFILSRQMRHGKRPNRLLLAFHTKVLCNAQMMALCYFVPSVTKGAALSFFHSKSPTIRVAVCLALALCLGCILYIWYGVVRLLKNVTPTFRAPPTIAPSAKLSAPLAEEADNSPGPDRPHASSDQLISDENFLWAYSNAVPGSMFVETYGLYFAPTSDPYSLIRRLVVLEDVFHASALAFSDGVKPEQGNCIEISGVMLGLCLLHFLFLTVLRPYATRLDLGTSVAMTVLNLIILSLCVAVALGDDDDRLLSALSVLSLIVNISLFVQAVFMMFWFYARSARKRYLILTSSLDDNVEERNEVARVPSSAVVGRDPKEEEMHLMEDTASTISGTAAPPSSSSSSGDSRREGLSTRAQERLAARRLESAVASVPLPPTGLLQVPSSSTMAALSRTAQDSLGATSLRSNPLRSPSSAISSTLGSVSIGQGLTQSTQFQF